MPEKPVPPVRRLRASLAIALSLAGLVVLILAGLYAARRQIAREAVSDWLRSRGVASESSFQELGPGRLVGRVRIGSVQHPDAIVERAEISYSLTGLLAGRGVQVTDVRLVHPVLAAQWRGGRFSAGALDPLIEEVRKRPPTPGAPSPRIRIEGGELRLATDYGPLGGRLDAVVDKGRLLSLDAHTAPAPLKIGGLAADLGPGELTARSSGGRLSLRLVAPFRTARLAGAAATDGRLAVDGDLSYPDLSAAQVTAGRVSAELVAQGAQSAGVRARTVRISAAAPDLRWTRAAAGDRVGGRLIGRADLQDVAAADLTLRGAGGDFKGAFASGRDGFLRLDGRAQAAGGWSGLGAPAEADSAEIAAVKRGFRAFQAAVDGVSLAADRNGVRARLTGVARLRPQAGGEVRLAPVGGGYRLTSAGGGLPRMSANVRRFALADGGAVADGDLAASLSIGPLEQLDLRAAGTLRIAGGTASLTASRCADVKVAHVELGPNDVERFSGRLCPAGGPLFRIGQGGWALAARAEQAAAAAPFLQADLAEGAGTVRMADDKGRLSAEAAIAHARVADAAKETRFRPLVMTGRAGLAHDLWTAALDFRTPGGAPVAHADLRHASLGGAGEVAITTPNLAFAPGGLQPADLSPLARPLGDQVAGAARFSGRFSWAKEQATSGGELQVPGLDFISPVGQVSGLSGRVVFSSLAPLTASPGQVLHVASVAAPLPLSDVSASFSLGEKGLVVATGEAAAGGGRLRIADLNVPFQPDAPITGVLLLDGVQVHDLVEASPFADRVDLDAKLTGRIPFEAQGGKVRVAGGALHAAGPGRLSISRTALTSVAAQGSVQASAPAAAAQIGSSDTFTDFAYQAVENLAFTRLDAQVDTRPDGRLGVLFHIVGYHDPPTRQEITMSWIDVLRRRLPDRQLPLPSGTAVDLTLDTTLNLDDLLADYGALTRLRNSPPVQP